MEKVNECPKSISLRIIFKNILLKNDKTINVVDNFLYFLLKLCQNFSSIIY